MTGSEVVDLPLDYGGPIDQPFEPFTDTVLEGSIIDRFDTVALRFASRVAIQDAKVSLTYADLAVLVERIAAATRAAIEDHPGPVALLLPAEAQFPAAMLGVLASGRAYIPLDASFPIERNRLIASKSGACAVLSSGDLVVDARTLFQTVSRSSISWSYPRLRHCGPVSVPGPTISPAFFLLPDQRDCPRPLLSITAVHCNALSSPRTRPISALSIGYCCCPRQAWRWEATIFFTRCSMVLRSTSCDRKTGTHPVSRD